MDVSTCSTCNGIGKIRSRTRTDGAHTLFALDGGKVYETRCPDCAEHQQEER